MASQEGVSHGELDSIDGSGQDGRVTKQDLLAYLAQRASGVNLSTPKAAVEVPSAAPAPAPATPSSPAAAPSGHGFRAPAPTVFPGDEIREMDRMRKLIADHMVMSKHVAPHVTSFVEADVTAIVRWREKVKSGYEKREGEKLTFTPIFMEAVVKAIKDFQMLDFNKDGKISRKELMLVPKLYAGFDEADTNKDNYLSLEEVRVFAAKYRARRDAAKAAQAAAAPTPAPDAASNTPAATAK